MELTKTKQKEHASEGEWKSSNCLRKTVFTLLLMSSEKVKSMAILWLPFFIAFSTLSFWIFFFNNFGTWSSSNGGIRRKFKSNTRAFRPKRIQYCCVITCVWTDKNIFGNLLIKNKDFQKKRFHAWKLCSQVPCATTSAKRSVLQNSVWNSSYCSFGRDQL